MKQLLTPIILLCTFLLLLSELSAQGNWTPKTAFPPGPRERAFHFTIGDKFYVGGGRGVSGTDAIAAVNERDFWAYEFATDTWEQLDDFPGEPFRNGASFVIDGIAYVVTGHDGTDYLDLFWKYDPATDTWEELPAFPGGPRSFPVAFASNGKGYVIAGGIQQSFPDPFYGQDVWEYDPDTNSWTERSPMPTKSGLPGSYLGYALAKRIGNYAHMKNYMPDLKV